MREKKKILNIVIVIMSIILVISVVSTIAKIKNNSDNVYSESDFSGTLSIDNGYHELVRMYHYNESNGAKETDKLKEYYSVAQYFEAASYYKVYQNVGDQEKAEQYHTKMQEAEKLMGKLSYSKDRIDKELGLN